MLRVPPSPAEAGSVVSSMNIPSCPNVLMQLHRELQKDDFDLNLVSKHILADVGLSAALLKTVNAPSMGLRHKVQSVQQAVSVIGATRLASLASGVMLRQVFAAGPNAVTLERFWDASHKRAQVMSRLANDFPGIKPDVAYTFGLFMDCGIAVLMQRFPDYKQTLAVANTDPHRMFTEVEEGAHQVNHVTVGYWLARSWHLDAPLSEAIRYHHDYDILEEGNSTTSDGCRQLAAFGLIAEHLIQSCSGRNQTVEWQKAGVRAMQYLGVSQDELDDLRTDVRDVISA